MTVFIKRRLDIDFTPFLTADYSQHQGSCIAHQVHELTEIHDRYGGFPDSYKMENTLIHQLWWNQDQVDYDVLGQQLGLEVKTVSSIKQPAGCVIPWHRDTFYQIKSRWFSMHYRNTPIMRANIFLQDYRMGHFIQYQDIDNEKLITVTDWTAGDALIWDDKVEHLGANCGFEPKYTLQVSGFLMF